MDIEHHPVLSQKRFDVQVVGRIDNLKGYVPVYSDRILNPSGLTHCASTLVVTICLACLFIDFTNFTQKK